MPDPVSPEPEAPDLPTRGRRLARWLRDGGWKAIAGAAAGAGLLATYSFFVGCRTGTCLLTSDVRTATLVGALVGLISAWPSPDRAAARPDQLPR